MTPVGHHPVVGQLLRGAGGSESEAPSPEIRRGRLARMSRMHDETDEDRGELASSIESSSREMQRLDQEREQKAEARRAAQGAILRVTLEPASAGSLVVDGQPSARADRVRLGQILDSRSRLYRSFEQQRTLPSGNRLGGSGLGLALTKRLELHGGTIDVESELGVGTAFTVRIPVA